MNDFPVCIFCGAETDNWWFHDKKNNSCRCWDCHHNGVAETEQETAKYSNFCSLLSENLAVVDKQHSPTPKFDLSIWQLHISEGSERLRRWANESARKRGYL